MPLPKTSGWAAASLALLLAAALWAQSGPRRKAGKRGPRDPSQFTLLKDEGFPLNLRPEIVPASEAPLDDGDMVMGTVINGQARAYPVNYMNGPTNEVVNDSLGGRAIAPSW